MHSITQWHPYITSLYVSRCGLLTSEQVDMKKVNLDVIKPWISEQITKILGFEDDVVIGNTSFTVQLQLT